MANVISILIDAKENASEQLKKVGKAADDMGGQSEKGGHQFGGLIGQIAIGNLVANGVSSAFGFVKDQIREATASAQENQSVMAQLGSVLQSTGGSAGVTADYAEQLADSIRKTTPIDDDAALAAENMLLTFTNIKKSQFGGATQAVMDMATAMNGGATPSAEQLRDTAIQVGKALNDPINGLATLHRVGVAFTDQQKAQISAMQQAGDTAGAQKVILAELSKEFSGSAAAAANTFGGRMQMLHNNFDDLRKGIITSSEDALKPFLDMMITGLSHIDADAIINAVSGAVWALSDALRGVIGVAGQFISQAMSVLAPGFRDLWAAIQNALPSIERLEPVLAAVARVVATAIVINFRILLEVWATMINVGAAVLGFFEKHRTALVALVGAITAVAIVFAAVLIPPMIVAAATAIASAISIAAAWVIAFAPIVLIGALVAVVVYEIVSHWRSIVAVAQEVWNTIVAATQASWNFLWQNIIKPVVDLVAAYIHIWIVVITYVFDVIRGLAIVAWSFLYGAIIKPIIDLISQSIQGWIIIFSAVWNTVLAITVPIWNTIRNIVVGVWNSIAGVWGGVAGWFGGVFGSILGMAHSVAGGISGAFSGAFSGAAGAIRAVINGMISAVNSVIHSVNNTAGKLPGVPHIGDIPHLATGGTLATGGIALVGEQGAELVSLPAGATVLPANQTQQLMNGGGGNIFNISVPVSHGTESERQAYAAKIASDISKILRSQGLAGAVTTSTLSNVRTT